MPYLHAIAYLICSAGTRLSSPNVVQLCADITLHVSESSQKGGCCACRVNDILDAAAFKHGKLKLKVEEVGALLAACHVY